MKGINRHSFHPDGGRTTNKELSIQDALLIKEMNMNAVRSHYPPDEHFLDCLLYTSGDIRYRDVNNDGKYDKDNDRDYLGSPTPKFVFGMTNRFSYKNFDLSILLTAQTGGKIYGILGRAIDRPSMGAKSNIMGHWRDA